MDIPEESQFCDIHKKRKNIQVCFDKACKVKATLCIECYKEKHFNCNSQMMISFNEIVESVLILDSNNNKEQFKSTLFTLAKAHKQAFIKRFDTWLECLLKAFNRITHKDLLNPITMGLIKSNFNIILNEKQMKIELSSKLDNYNEEKLRQIIETIDEQMEVILNDSMIQVEKLGKSINELLITDNKEESTIEGSHIAFKKLKISMNEIKIKNQELEENLKLEKNRTSDLESIIKENDQNMTDRLNSMIKENNKNMTDKFTSIIKENDQKMNDILNSIKEEHKIKLDEQRSLVFYCNNKIESLKTKINDDRELLNKLDLYEKKNTPSYWSYPKEIDAVRDGNGVFFKSLNVHDNTWYNLLYTVPLDRHTMFKITFKSIDKQRRELFIYIGDRNNNPVIPIYNNLGFDSSVNYYGYTHMSGLTGKTPSKKSSDPNGFDIGKEYFIEFWPRDMVRYYNEEETLNLVGSFKGKKGPFHLMIRHLFHRTTFTVERLF